MWRMHVEGASSARVGGGRDLRSGVSAVRCGMQIGASNNAHGLHCWVFKRGACEHRAKCRLARCVLESTSRDLPLYAHGWVPVACGQ